MPLPWGDVHLPNNWHLSADRVPVPSVPMSSHTSRGKIHHRCIRLAPDLIHGWRYAMDSPLRDTWLPDDHYIR
ncbi:ADP-ribosylation factor-related protein 1 [Hordeum vulgare]|nr:ADP-ribosylation factor-related protein 1 [Hordeum vulgare]